MADEYLVAPSGPAALEAAKRMEFNFLKYRIRLMEDENIVPVIKDALEEREIDPRELTLEQIYAIQDRIQMYGTRRGILNKDKGFTNRWLPKNVRRRATDNRYCLPIPRKQVYREKLLEDIPNWEAYVEEEQTTWFPEDNQ
jgi:hypothetical protein